jgi:hypothetical protein
MPNTLDCAHHDSGSPMKYSGAFASLAATFLFLGIEHACAVTVELSPTVRKEINVTPDSSRNWKPTPEQQHRALKTVQAYLNAVESSSLEESYALLSESIKGQQALEQFIQDVEKFKMLAGPMKSWRVLKVTWTKDPAQAPFPGVYAAVDFSAKFDNVDRNCGYVVLHQPPAGGDFAIMRRESNYLDNASARKIEEQHSRAWVEKTWAALSQHCPNYKSSLDAR